MINSPFAAVIAKAEKCESDARQADQRRREAAELARQQALLARQAQDAQQALVDFGRRFLASVADRVVRDGWSAEYIRKIEQYSECLLRRPDATVELPSINDRHAGAILDKFEYGLKLAADHGNSVPDGTFKGQQLLAERETQRGVRRETALIIRPGVKPRGKRDESAPATKVELKPAITPKKGSRKAA